ncbi:3-deoxy-7-phosphoheptulonate synthase class II [Lentzea sp. NBRC 105346]|uniref:3-deoxy-7-phosphoheptulonate synthase n=1 Tax=Lentzea sp. NBRC 105346 TaxID=3032205 RepID=UPI002554A547|nr:3-deoxy-7-phosphoheptulonate synthase class II [Lentzea sp. NBRC 105346]
MKDDRSHLGRRLTTWRDLPRAQQPAWPDPLELRSVLSWLSRADPLVSPADCDALFERMGAVARGEAFLLQGGPCAETFAEASAVGGTLRTLDQMATLLEYAGASPVVRVARLAGQYAKPRSSSVERIGGVEVPVYRGDAVNGVSLEDRLPDPRRLRMAYHTASSTLDIMRGSGFFTSHEGLLLDYEDALTRGGYATSAHLLWIGERTRDLGGGHVGYFSSIRNPIAVKLGPTARPSDVVALADRLDPARTAGRLTFISRMGARKVRDVLPALVSAVPEAVWVCDPMHGNTFTSPDGYKTRSYDEVLDEVRGFFEVHRALGTHAGGLHLELTGDDVTECLGAGVTDLSLRYQSACDPRLNRAQSLDLAFEVAALLRTPVLV